MKFMLFFWLGLIFSIFDYFYFFLFFSILLWVFAFDYGYFVFSGLFFCDPISFFLVFMTIFVLFFCLNSSLLDTWNLNGPKGLVFCLLSITFLLLLSFFTLNVFIFYLCFEWIFMIMFFFVLVWGYSPERLQASFYMVFYTIVVSFPFLIYIVGFELNFTSLKFINFFNYSCYWWFFLFLVFFVKLPVYMVHLWLPKAHVEAPVSGSMILAGVLLKLGGYGFLRFSTFVPFSLSLWSGYFFSFGLIGGLVSCFLCLRQTDLKAFIAYSSVCHMGFCLSGLYCYSFYGFNGGLYMLVAHGFCSSCLFYLLYVFYERYHSRSLLMVKGISLLMPSLVMFWFLFSILNIGVPPSFAFFSEITILVGMIGMNFYSLVLSGLFLFLAGVYGIFFYTASSHGVPLLDGKVFPLSLRESLNTFGHFYPLIFIPLLMNYYCF